MSRPPLSSPAEPSGIWGAVVVVLAVAASYANALHGPFVYDDILSIVENPSLRTPWRLGEVLWPTVDGGVTVAGRPLLNLSLALNHAVSGADPWSYHVTNAAIHAGAALLLLGLVRRTRGCEGRVAVAIAGLWAVHPLHTQAVTYVVQRAESLMGFFYLLTLYAFARAMGDEPRRRAWQAASVAACALGMATKEVMVTAPLVALLYDRTFVGGSFAVAWRARRGLHAALAATWFVAGALLLATGANRGGTVGLGTGVALWAYPLTQFEAVARYLALAVWPAPLVFEYGTFWVTSIADVAGYAVPVLALLGATVVALVRWPVAGFLGAAFFLILAPTSLAPGTIQMIVEHRMYLPLAAAIAALVLGLRRATGERTALYLAAGLALIALTARRNRDYASARSLWTDTVMKRPLNPRAHEGLAEALTAEGRQREAVAARREAMRLAPTDARVRFNLGLALATAGELEEAVGVYAEALRLAPDDARTHNNLAVALAQLGRMDEALRHYAAASRLKPDEAAFRLNEALAQTRSGAAGDALAGLAAAARLEPGNLDYAMLHGNALLRAGRRGEALAEFERAAALAPRHAAVRIRVADTLVDLERDAEAVPHYEAALAIAPDNATAWHNLGVALARLERWDEARRAFDEALRLKPDYADARRNREQLRSVTGR